MKNDCHVFVSSADSYADIWPVFFDLFKRNWPQFNGVIYLNTEEKTFSSEGLNIICTKVGNLGSFGKVFHAGLDKIKSDHVLFMMIDYIFMGKVDETQLDEYYRYFVSSGLDVLSLTYQNYHASKQLVFDNRIEIVSPPCRDIFSFQIAFWKKSFLYEMVLPYETPWASEWYGTKRANKMKIKFGCLAEDAGQPITYDTAGCLHHGKWLDNAVEYLDSIDYKFDIEKRGHYKILPPTLKKRFTAKKMLIKAGLKGSYWDLMKRRSF